MTPTSAATPSHTTSVESVVLIANTGGACVRTVVADEMLEHAAGSIVPEPVKARS